MSCVKTKSLETMLLISVYGKNYHDWEKIYRNYERYQAGNMKSKKFRLEHFNYHLKYTFSIKNKLNS